MCKARTPRTNHAAALRFSKPRSDCASGAGAGATCPDGSAFVPLVPGSQWSNVDGAWTLVGCPPGYNLNAQQCELCPGGCYCIGGSVPATACGSDLYALPGAQKAADCTPSVFVVVTVTVPILRYSFSSDVEGQFQVAMASVAGTPPGYVVITGVVGDSSTTVTSNVATPSAKSAAVLTQALIASAVQDGLASYGFEDAILEEVQVTACLPGFELSESQTCQMCPANYFCIGGSSPANPCSADYFAIPGSNSSLACRPAVFVVLVISFPVPQQNFTDSFKSGLQEAVASAAGVPLDTVFGIISQSVQGRRASGPGVADASVLVTVQIAARDSAAAASISGSLSTAALDSNFVARGLPAGTLQSVSTSAETSAYALPMGIIVGSFVAGFVVVAAAVGVLLCSKTAMPPEEQLLLSTRERLRKKLHITAKHGYVLRCFHCCLATALFLVFGAD